MKNKTLFILLTFGFAYSNILESQTCTYSYKIHLQIINNENNLTPTIYEYTNTCYGYYFGTILCSLEKSLSLNFPFYRLTFFNNYLLELKDCCNQKGVHFYKIKLGDKLSYLMLDENRKEYNRNYQKNSDTLKLVIKENTFYQAKKNVRNEKCSFVLSEISKNDFTKNMKMNIGAKINGHTKKLTN